MKVILKQDVKALGYKDDVVTVKNGYANNFLIPQGMAMVANESNLKVLAENMRQAAFKQEKIKGDAEAMAGKMNGLTIKIGAKAGANDKIFGSITSLQISQALKNEGYEVDRRKIVLDQDVKTLGSFTATVNLHREISVQVNLEVIAE
ncbi:MAG: 50S ribosomal protein L9 [Bacteroidota bacterium]|nr:50S ribosomal protein L9 [Bacteroidota bacterium]MDX5431317.1 50S ribosomal protein L9 [Bacteroidota bacterium]MDX5470055.1 50S ribosomal protein L9 [Bacteroidota bacterium]